jgi:hypothetical protein
MEAVLTFSINYVVKEIKGSYIQERFGCLMYKYHNII